MSAEQIYLETDNIVWVRGLKDQVTGSYVNDATITATLYDKDDQVVSGAENLPVPYVNGSDGDYAGAIPHTVSLTAGEAYTVKVTVTKGDYQTVYKLKRNAAYYQQ